MVDCSETDVLLTARTWKDAGHRVALATVISTWGSSPRLPGSRLAVRDDRLFVGSVSGGCVENQVLSKALEVMESGRPTVFEVGVTNDRAWEVGLACGGRVEIYVEPLE
jgi:xanthine/CO dehydrogenase XdhC/CoxF family maturation factor